MFAFRQLAQRQSAARPVPNSFLSLSSLLALVIVSLLVLAASQVLAQPPTMPLPSQAEKNEDLLSQFWGWGNFALEILLILIGAAIFIMVTWSVVANFIEVSRAGGSFLAAVPRLGVGLFVLAISGVLLTIGWNVLQTTTLTP